jgi:DHA2 family multidrug resistance protein
MIVYRALQGFVGGGMIPTVFATAYAIFPRERQSMISPVIGLVATLAPTIGPTVGGYLTDVFSWHWLFLINIGPGMVVTFATWALVDFDRPEPRLFARFDWWGLLTMAAFLGSLEYVLEEGPTKDWFDDAVILSLAILALVAGVLFFWRALAAREPVVDLRAFLNRNFAAGSAFSFVMGIGLYGLTYLYPVYLSRVRGYSALMIGETMFVTGACMFLTAPVAGRLVARLDPRVMMAMGFAGFALGTWQVTAITTEWDFWELMVPQILRGVSLMICMVPINNVALGMLTPDQLKNASGLFNLTRNLGGAVGLAIINTVLNDRLDLHLARLHEAVAWGHGKAEETLANLAAALAPLGSDAGAAALRQLSLMVRRQATVMAFADVFFVLTFLFLALVCLVPLMKRPKPAAAGGGA